LHTLSDIYLIVARSDVELRLAFCGKRGSRHSSDLHRCRRHCFIGDDHWSRPITIHHEARLSNDTI